MSRLGVAGPGSASVSRGRRVTGVVAGSGTVTLSVPFSPAMADLDFTASATVEDVAGDLRVLAVTAKTVSSVTVLLGNADALNAASGTVHVLAVHD